MYLKYAVLPVTDIDRAIAFYTGPLRLTLAVDIPGEGGHRRVELSFPTGDTRLLLSRRELDGGLEEPALVLTVPDVNAAFERLGTLGIVFLTPPASIDGRHHARFRDSEGNLVLLEAAAPSSEFAHHAEI